MIRTVIIGASGYTGAELAAIVERHPNLELSALYVSNESEDAHKKISLLYPKLSHIELSLLPLSVSYSDLNAIVMDAELILLATAHEVSHRLVMQLYAIAKEERKSPMIVDLSGAYRVDDPLFYQSYYGFEHEAPELLKEAVYGLAEWNEEAIKEKNGGYSKSVKLIAVPGCYPTASQLPLRALSSSNLLDLSYLPVVNATSGVSGAGRKASLTSSFCHVSLQAYGVFNHRHQPEISNHLGYELLFTPHLGCFKRGILATISAKLMADVSFDDVSQCMHDIYDQHPLIRLRGETMPAIQDVEYTPYCDIGWQVKGSYIIMSSAIDNLLKGAASQAIQSVNLYYGFPVEEGLL